MSEGVFIDGVLWAAQQLIIHAKESSMAEELMIESGFTLNQFLYAQRKSGYESRMVNRITRRAFRNVSTAHKEIKS